MSSSPRAVPAAEACPAPARPLLTVADVAEELKMKPATVRRMAAGGLVGYYRLNGKALRFTRADVDGLLALTRVEPRATRSSALTVKR